MVTWANVFLGISARFTGLQSVNWATGPAFPASSGIGSSAARCLVVDTLPDATVNFSVYYRCHRKKAIQHNPITLTGMRVSEATSSAWECWKTGSFFVQVFTL